jgi:ABC-type Mn2+/Zn2+ transport system ATPase subunit
MEIDIKYLKRYIIPWIICLISNSILGYYALDLQELLFGFDDNFHKYLIIDMLIDIGRWVIASIIIGYYLESKMLKYKTTRFKIFHKFLNNKYIQDIENGIKATKRDDQVREGIRNLDGLIRNIKQLGKNIVVFVTPLVWITIRSPLIGIIVILLRLVCGVIGTIITKKIRAKNKKFIEKLIVSDNDCRELAEDLSGLSSKSEDCESILNRIDKSKEGLYESELPIMWAWQKYAILNLTFNNIIFAFVLLSLYADTQLNVVTKIMIVNSTLNLSSNLSRIIQLLENVTTQYAKLEVYLNKLNKMGDKPDNNKLEIDIIDSILIKELNIDTEKGKSNFIQKSKNIRLEGGDIVGLFGNIGTGKTTFIKGLIGYCKNIECDILINGEIINIYQLLDITYVITQKKQLPRTSLSILEILTGVSKEEVDIDFLRKILKSFSKKIDALKDYMEDIDKFLDLKYEDLAKSGGQELFLTAISGIYKSRNMRILIMDELDASTGNENSLLLMDLIIELKKPDQIIFLVSHKDTAYLRCTKMILFNYKKNPSFYEERFSKIGTNYLDPIIESYRSSKKWREKNDIVEIVI